MASRIASCFDGVIEKPITPDKLHAVFASPVAVPQDKMPAMRTEEVCSFDNSLLHFLAGNDSADYKKELNRYLAILESKRSMFANVWKNGDRWELASVSHDLIAHAKFVGAHELARAMASLEKECIYGVTAVDPKWKATIDSQVGALEQ